MSNNQFFANIQRQYGINTRDDFRAIQRLTEKLSSNVSREVFLLKCRRYEIVPRFILDKTTKMFSTYTTTFKRETNSIMSYVCNKILGFEIGMCNRSIRQTQIRIASLKMRLPSNDPITDQFISIIDEFYEKNLADHNQTLCGKFSYLLQSQNHLPDIKYEETFVKNSTNLKIPFEMSILLSLGPKFALEPDRVPIPEIIRDLEYIVSRYSHPLIVNAVRGQLTYTLTKHSKQSKRPNRIQLFLRRATLVTAKFLKDNPDVFISNSDKGNKTVIGSRLDYKGKMLEHIGDISQFEPLQNDPTPSCVTRLNNKLKTIYEKRSITRRKKLHLQSTTAIPPRVYGQYKVHKLRPDGKGHPLRLITSTVKTVSYNVSRELTSILTKAYNKPQFTIKNSRGVLNSIRGLKILRGHRMASFDMENCFGSISTALAIEIIEKDFDDKISPHTTMDKSDFIDLLRIVLDECNYFLYDHQFYKQINGIFMGSSLGSIIVQIITEHIIVKVLGDLKKKGITLPILWLVYVDDHLVICREEVIPVILKHLNEFAPGRIKFTHELENQGTINFLDLTLTRQCGNIITNWYTKPIASNRILNYFSAHPRNTIINTAKSLAKKVFEFSHTQFHQNNVVKIKDILSKNNFPSREIERIIDLAARPTINTNKPVKPNVGFSSLAYVPRVSEALVKKIKYFIPDVTVAHKPEIKLDRFYSKQKDKINDDDISDVVYQVNSQDSEIIYIGETTQKKGVRTKQHKNSVSATNLAKPNLASALALHTKTTGEQFDFENIMTLDRNSNKRKLQISEVNHIIMNIERTCNYKKDTANIAPSYFNLLRQHANKNDPASLSSLINRATPTT